MADEDDHGIECLEYRCLIRPDEVEEKTAGGIILPDANRDQEAGGVTEGILIAVAAFAFTYENGMKDAAPPVGTKVIFARYKGARVTGNDGLDYILINDKDILGVRK